MFVLDNFDKELYKEVREYAKNVMKDNNLTEIIYGFRTTDKIVLAEKIDELTMFQDHKCTTADMSFIDVCAEMNEPLQKYFCNIYYLVNKETA